MIRIFCVIALAAAVTARPNVPTFIFDTNTINSETTNTPSDPVLTIQSPTLELHKTNIIHNKTPFKQPASLNDYISPGPYLNHVAPVAEAVATPYGHHGGGFFSGFGPVFSSHHYVPSFWYPPPIFPSFGLPSFSPALAPAPAAKPEPASESAEQAPTLPFIPIASQILDGLFWMPLQQLLINVQQALTQPPPKKDEADTKNVPINQKN